MARTNRTGRERRARQVADLERRIDRLEAEVAWLRRVVRDGGERDCGPAVGPCPNCTEGVLAIRRDELRCSTCGCSRLL